MKAPPIEGRANEALIAFLAETFHQSKSSVQLLSGQSSRSKLFLLRGVALADVEAAVRNAMLSENHLGKAR